MTPTAIIDLGFALSEWVCTLKRAPSGNEVSRFITNFIRARKNGKLMT